jgi:hypothetical protein
MIIPDKKKAATVIVSMMHGQDLKTEDEGSSDRDECEALGQDLLDAVAGKDAMGAYNALRAIFFKVDAEPHEEYKPEEEEEEEEY